MKTYFTIITFIALTSVGMLEAAKAVCTCSGGKRPPNVEIDLGDNPKPVCEKECAKIGLQLVNARKR